jgi:hypothetical protein
MAPLRTTQDQQASSNEKKRMKRGVLRFEKPLRKQEERQHAGVKENAHPKNQISAPLLHEHPQNAHPQRGQPLPGLQADEHSGSEEVEPTRQFLRPDGDDQEIHPPDDRRNPPTSRGRGVRG